VDDAVAAGGREVAATAVAAGLPLYTRNPEDFSGRSELLRIVEV
jgi:hypothetical protein